MNINYALAFLLVAASLVWPSRKPAAEGESGSALRGEPGAAPRAFPERLGVALFAVSCGVLCAVVAWQNRLTDEAARSQTPLPGYVAHLPLLFFMPSAPLSLQANASLEDLIRVLTVVESALLLAIALLLSRCEFQRLPYRLIVGASAVALSASAFAGTTTCIDLYLYVAHALVWPAQYHPPGEPFGGESAVLNRLWGTPVMPSAYGPLWEFVARPAVLVAGTLAQQLVLVRALLFVAIVGSVLALFALFPARRTPILFALNPALYDMYLVRAHNDIVGVLLILLAALARRRTWLAVVFVAAAGAVKLPFLLTGAVIFWGAPTLRGRLVPAVCAVALGAGASLVFGGAAYLGALHEVYRLYDHQPSRLGTTVQEIVAALALAAIAVALLLKRFWLGAAWTFPALGQFPLAWYLAWSVPYVIWSETIGLVFLVSWPIATMLLSTDYLFTPLFVGFREVVMSGAGLALAIAVVLRYRDWRRGAPA